MRMHEFVILGLIAFVLVAGRTRPRLTHRRIGSELSRLVDRTIIELVQEHLDRSPLPVRLTTGHDLRGAFVRLDADELRLRLRLYDRAPALPAEAHLTSVRWAGGRGWVVRAGDARATWSLLGWHLAVQPRGRTQQAAVAGPAHWWE